jgi:hypothetical protein
MNSSAWRIPVSLFAWAFMATFGLIGCGSKKNLSFEKPEKKPDSFLNEKLSENELRFKTLSFRSTVKSQLNGANTNCKAVVRIRKDSATWVMITVIGKPVATLIISTDTVKFQNKIKKEYFVGSIDYMSKLTELDLSYSTFQDVLTGNAIEHNPQTSYDTKVDSTSYLICSPNSRRISKALELGAKSKVKLLYRYWLDPENYKMNRQIVNNLSDTTSIEAGYSQYLEIEDQLFPKKQKIIMTSMKDSGVIELNLSKIRINEKLSYPFRISDKYTRIE